MSEVISEVLGCKVVVLSSQNGWKSSLWTIEQHFFQALPRLGKLDKYPHLRTEVNLNALKLLSNVIGKMTIIGIVKMMIFFDQNE